MTVLRAIITDIEGTTSSMSFVKEVLFPYARKALPMWVQQYAHTPDVRHWLEQAAAEMAIAVTDKAALVQGLQSWIDHDRKHTALKALQGMIWENGYRHNDYRAHVYPDVLPVLQQWQAAGLKQYVYSSGSIAAQKLFFAHSQAGDMTSFFSGYFDTETGNKREAVSYARIIESIDIPASNTLFLSDVVAELDAARASGLQTMLVDRLHDYPQPRLGQACNGHRRVTDFSQITAL